MDLSKITAVPNAVNVVIEISANAEPVKYEFNKELGLLQVDRFLSTSMTYPCNYGFIPNTCAGDGDPVDVLVLTQFPLASSVLISVRPIG
ncbi:MAG: inorganic diphosphatase, partial [Wolbachia endosymbiont of Andrena agilissima]|nr:inorganic diphosphatase [Wolbachia endosymbiont of Andrena agilissima]